MRVYPQWGETPSESTVELAANHALLNLLAPAVSWIYVPTKREERSLGYDASLQGKKACVIQYKRARPLTRAGGVSIRIKPSQHKTLIDSLPQHDHPWVLFGAAEFHSYTEFASSANHSSGSGLYEHLLFVDAHEVPHGATTLRFQRPHPTGAPTAQAFKGKTKVAGAIACFDAPALSRRLRRCTIGSPAELLSYDGVDADRQGHFGRVSVLFTERAV